MPLTYDDLRDRIGDKLGYGVSSSSWSGDSEKATRIERILVDGLRRFFDPEVMQGDAEQHQWSFVCPTIQITLTAETYRYVLPKNFSMLNGNPCFAPGEDSVYPPLEVTGPEQLWYSLQQDDAAGRPRICAVTLASASEASGSRYELLLYPNPDDDYVLMLPYRINPVFPGQDESVPLGGQPHEMTIIEACLAEAEAFDEFSNGIHEQRFQARLRTSISHDRQAVSPYNLGVNRDNSDGQPLGRGMERWPISSTVVTYQGLVVDG